MRRKQLLSDYVITLIVKIKVIRAQFVKPRASACFCHGRETGMCILLLPTVLILLMVGLQSKEMWITCC